MNDSHFYGMPMKYWVDQIKELTSRIELLECQLDDLHHHLNEKSEVGK